MWSKPANLSSHAFVWNDGINRSVYDPPTDIFSDIDMLGGCAATELFYAIIPTLFSYFLPFCYPYILLHFNVFLLHVQSSDADISSVAIIGVSVSKPHQVDEMYFVGAFVQSLYVPYVVP